MLIRMHSENPETFRRTLMAAVALEANSLSPFVHKHSNLPSSFWYSNDFEENFMLSVSMCPLLFRYREKKCHF